MQKIDYRPDIDVLRAVAVLTVIFFHANSPIFTGGFIGVDVFFVISGYLISRIIILQIKNANFRLSYFYASRLRRLFPALFFMSFIIGLFYLLFPVYDAGYFAALRRSLRSALLFYSNIHFYLHTDYFDVAAQSLPFLHTWSLGVEAQFYLLYPLFFVYIYKRCSGNITTFINIFFAISLILSIIAVEIYPKAGFYLLPTRIWELLLGACLAVGDYSPASQRNKQLLIVAGISLILGAAILFNRWHYPNMPGVWALVPCGGAAMFIAGGKNYNKKGLLLSFLSNRYCITVGLISYSLYLWHWPLFVIYRFLFLETYISFHIFSILLFFTFIFAFFSWKYIETPFRTRLASWPLKKQFTLAGICLFAGVIMCSSIKNNLNIYHGPYTRITKYHKNIANYGILGDEKSPHPQFLLLGDSHAAALAPALDLMGKENKIQGRAFYSDCSFLNGYRGRAKNKKDEIHSKLKQLITDEQYKTVFIYSRWALGIKGYLPSESLNNPRLDRIGYFYDNGEKHLQGKEAVRESLFDTISFMLSNGTEKIYIISSTPECSTQIPQSANILSILNKENVLNKKLGVKLSDFLDRNKEVHEILADAQKNFTDNVFLIDPAIIFFDDSDISTVVENGVSLYSDDDHLSFTGALKLMSLIPTPGTLPTLDPNIQ